MSLATVRNFAKLCSGKNPILFTAVRNHWNKDYVPGAFPMNQEQRDAAAKKYGIHPDEYKPFPNDGAGFGDYPDIPLVSGDAKDPFYPWDNPELKRNFNETLSNEFDLIGEDRFDISYKYRIPLATQIAQFVLVMAGCFGVYLYLENMKQFPGLIPKQYPHKGEKHFSFESE